jgi:hypothetical protein
LTWFLDPGKFGVSSIGFRSKWGQVKSRKGKSFKISLLLGLINFKDIIKFYPRKQTSSFERMKTNSDDFEGACA